VNIVKLLKKLVLKFNENNLYDRDGFNFIQPLANRYNKIIISINFNTIQINIPNVNNNIVYCFDVISFLYLDDLAQSNGYNNNDFKDILQNLGFTFKSNPSLLFVLKSFFSKREIIVLTYFFDGMRRYYFAFQPKPLNNSSNVKINISEYLGKIILHQ
jgi:hypothetical protein